MNASTITSMLFYYVFLFFFSFASSTISSYLNTSLITHICSAQQSQTLLLFKQSLLSINNSIGNTNDHCQVQPGSAGYYPTLMNWDTSSDCCDWNGVTCDYSTGDVIGLDLSCGMLQGTIHRNTSLFNLPHLQRLNIAFNDFSGSQIPREIGRFSKSLTHLNISDCRFSGQVPTNITFLHNLVSLDFSLNYLSLEPHVFLNLLQNTTSLKKLSLSYVNISSSLPSYLNISSSSLKLFNLEGTKLQGKLPDDIFNSQSLEILDLSGNSFTGQIPSKISLLPKLVSFYIFGSQNNLRIQPHVFNGFLNNSTLLRDLRISDVNISSIFDVINISSSLNYLDLMNCSLMVSLPKSPLNLTRLTYLNLGNNKLNGTLPSWLFTLPSLEYLDLSNNMFSGDVPFNSFALPPLKKLSLGENQLGGHIDQGPILQLTNLTWLGLSYNNFSSDWELDTLLSSLTDLRHLDLSYSGLSITTSNATHHVDLNIGGLSLASCKIKVFPQSIRSMKILEVLDLSSNEIHGDIPIWEGHIGGFPLRYLNLAHNFITGLPPFQSLLHYLFLNSNQFQGPLPPSICNMTLFLLDLSNNSFGGVIPECLGNIYTLQELYLNSNQLQGLLPPTICNMMRNLYSLDLSNNSFGGVIPQCFGNITSNLELMNLGNNDFHGTIPDMFDGCGELQGLILNGNQLQGELPTSLSSCHPLRVLDLGNNHLNGTFPDWLGGLSQLQVLNLKSNNFHGPIVTSSPIEFSFRNLRVLDLSYNRFVGQLPRKYFQNFNAMKGSVKRSTKLEYLNMGNSYYSVVMTVKGLELPFTKISVDYMIVDLSNNGFEGEIPNIIGNLTSLIVLNLSRNNLTGQIPHVIGNLKEIEPLDLSCNRLTGEIPPSLGDITNLEFLNLSENNLAGHIPEGKQFSTFIMSSFQGNPKLCGFPLPKKCSEHPHEPHFDDGGEDEVRNGFTWRVVMMGYGCGTFVGLLMGYLMLSSGRPKWFSAIADAGEHLIHIRRPNRRYIYIGK